MEGIWSWFLSKTNGPAAGAKKLICYSYDIPQKDGEWVLCCRAQDQSTSGHNIANYILLEKNY
jgi:hypothetical protein